MPRSSSFARCVTRRDAAPKACFWPRAGVSLQRRARQRPASGGHRLRARRSEAPACGRDHCRDRGRRRRGNRNHGRDPRQDERQGQPADVARGLSGSRQLARACRPQHGAVVDRRPSLRDPGNIGTILRTGDAAGAGGLILIDECADPFSVEAVRASMGALFTQQVATAKWGGIPALAENRPRTAGRDQPEGHRRLSRSRLPLSVFPPDRQ